MAELAAPGREASEKAVAITVGAAEDKLWGIASVDLGKKAMKVPDQINAIKTLAQLRGWNAPEKTELTSPIKIERVERVIVDHPKPKTADKP